MKRTILFTVAATILFGTATPAQAKKPKDQEFRHVIVTLATGEQVDGYLTSNWHADASLFQFKKENFSFKLAPSPDSKETTRYTADEVTSVEYVERTEDAPDGIRWESHPIAAPGISDRYRTMRRLVCHYKTGENATVYWWKTWDVTTNAKGQTRRLITVYGIRFHDDEIVYPYSLATSVLLKDKKPGLKEFAKDWYKGPEGKERKKADKEDPAWMLAMYDAYLAAQK